MTSHVGLTRKSNATCEKLAPPVAPDSVLIGSARMLPSRPPTSARNADSIMNELRIEMREKPSARSVPISRVRADDQRVHRVHRAEHRADAHDDADEQGQHRQRRWRSARPVRRSTAARSAIWTCMFGLAFSSVLNASSVRRVRQPQRQRLIAAGAVEDRRQRVVVAPDLAFESAAFRREDADHLPRLALQLDAAADLEPLVAIGGLLARR